MLTVKLSSVSMNPNSFMLHVRVIFPTPDFDKFTKRHSTNIYSQLCQDIKLFRSPPLFSCWRFVKLDIERQAMRWSQICGNGYHFQENVETSFNSPPSTSACLHGGRRRRWLTLTTSTFTNSIKTLQELKRTECVFPWFATSLNSKKENQGLVN